MEKKIRKIIKMRSKIFLSCLICMVVALAAQTSLFYRSSSQIIYTQAQQMSRSTIDNLQEDLYNINESIENSLIKIYNQTSFMSDITDRVPAERLVVEYDQITYDLVHSAFTPSQNLAALYLYTPDNQLISSYQHAQTPIYLYPEDVYTSISQEDANLIRHYVESDERTMLITSVFNKNRQVQLIRYVLKVYRKGNEYAGYLIADIDPKPYISLMEKYQYSDDQIIWLQPSEDKIALVLGPWQDNGAYKEATESIRSLGVDVTIDNEESDYELFFAHERKYNLTAYTLYPEFLLQLNQQSLLANTILVVGGIIVLFFFLFLLISRSLTRPLTYVLSTMQRIKQGETTLRMKPMRQDEIGLLGNEFNEMLDKTQQLLKQEYALKLHLKDAKYKALQAQVNPHFLYNTLDTMSAISKAQSCTTVATLCHVLSNVFRYNLEMQTPYASIHQEIVHLKNYMYIMNVRMNYSVNLDIHIDNDLLGYLIPRLSIQPLVENSIQHGLKNKRGEKRVIVGAVKEDDSIVLWVEDNGVGMAAPDAINARMEHSLEDALSKSISVGIDNINARARLLFSDRYGVRVSSELNVGSRVTLRIPVLHGKEKENGP